MNETQAISDVAVEEAPNETVQAQSDVVTEKQDVTLEVAPSNDEEKPTTEENVTHKYLHRKVLDHFIRYWRKWGGQKGAVNPYQRPAILYMLLAFIASFLGIAFCALFHFYVMDMVHPTKNKDVMHMLIGSFGASAVLIYGEIKSPLAQPRNFVGGHMISALIGVLIKLIIVVSTVEEWLKPWAAAFAVACSIFAMHITRTTHPPGGATALIAVMYPQFPWFGFQYLFLPVLSGCCCMLIIALLVNNLRSENSYPVYWW